MSDSNMERWAEVILARQAPELARALQTLFADVNRSQAIDRGLRITTHRQRISRLMHGHARPVDEVKVFETFGGDLPVII